MGSLNIEKYNNLCGLKKKKGNDVIYARRREIEYSVYTKTRSISAVHLVCIRLLGLM